MHCDLFRDIKTLTGPEVLYSFHVDDRWMYFVGEDHEIGSVSNHTHVVDVICSQKERLMLLSEHGTEEVIESAASTSNIGCPLKALARKYIYEPSAVSQHIRFLCDIRRDAPYCILGILYEFTSYLYLYKRDVVRTQALYKTFFEIAKHFEKRAIDSFRDRKNTKAFFLRLFHPDKTLPKWFISYCEALGHPTGDHEIKKRLKTLKETEPHVYKNIANYIESELDYRLMDVNIYTPVMASVAQKRHTASLHFALTKSQHVSTFFTSLFGLLLEINLLVHIYTEKHDNIVVFTGSAHSYNLAKFLKMSSYDEENSYSIHRNPMGYLDFKDKKYMMLQNPLLSPLSLLKNTVSGTGK